MARNVLGCVLDFATELVGRFVFADGTLSVPADIEPLARLFGDEAGFSFASFFAVHGERYFSIRRVSPLLVATEGKHPAHTFWNSACH